MAKSVRVQVNTANVLTLLGSLYRNPADALKEYISNALDEWLKARGRGELAEPCRVTYTLERDKVTISYNAPGMNRKEFESALKRVADSIKKGEKVPQIGQLGIGIWAFNQVGSSATFYSKKSLADPTIKVILRRDTDHAEIEESPKRESLEAPGMTIVVRGLLHDATKPRGSLAPERLQRAFAERFDSYLRNGSLVVAIHRNGATYEVKPAEIGLPTLAEGFKEIHLPRDWSKVIRTQLWFDQTVKSKVSIRHAGVVIVDDLRAISALGLEESVFASGYVRGYIDADFLKPLPARTGFEENQDWINFLAELDAIRPSIEAEVQNFKSESEQQQRAKTFEEALAIAREIFEAEDFQDLVLLGGMRRRRETRKQRQRTVKAGKRTGERSKGTGDRSDPQAFRVNFGEIAFEEGPALHSRFVSGTVQANILNQNYRIEMAGGENQKRSYLALLIGKETIGFNDGTGKSSPFLEKLLGYTLQLKRKAARV